MIEEDVKKELDKEEVHLMTVVDALGCGRQKGVTEIYRGVKGECIRDRIRRT